VVQMESKIKPTKTIEKLLSNTPLVMVPLVQVHAYWKGKISEGTRFDALVQADRIRSVSRGYRFMTEAIMGHFM